MKAPKTHVPLPTTRNKIAEHALQLQPRSNFFQPNVTPLSSSNLQLPGGKTEPFYYCLGVDSTIPFVSLQGGGVSQKVFTWGEMIEVPPGQTCTIKNESYMRGDIQVNSGHDYAAKPERISVPFQITIDDTIFPGFRIYSAPFPADTRRCRRAFLACNIAGGSASTGMAFSGRNKKHSFPSVNNTGGPTGYDSGFSLPPFTNIDLIPMSYGGFDEGAYYPAGLTDQVIPLIFSDLSDTIPVGVNALAFYVLEY